MFRVVACANCVTQITTMMIQRHKSILYIYVRYNHGCELALAHTQYTLSTKYNDNTTTFE